MDGEKKREKKRQFIYTQILGGLGWWSPSNGQLIARFVRSIHPQVGDRRSFQICLVETRHRFCLVCRIKVAIIIRYRISRSTENSPVLPFVNPYGWLGTEQISYCLAENVRRRLHAPPLGVLAKCGPLIVVYWVPSTSSYLPGRRIQVIGSGTKLIDNRAVGMVFSFGTIHAWRGTDSYRLQIIDSAECSSAFY